MKVTRRIAAHGGYEELASSFSNYLSSKQGTFLQRQALRYTQSSALARVKWQRNANGSFSGKYAYPGHRVMKGTIIELSPSADRQWAVLTLRSTTFNSLGLWILSPMIVFLPPTIIVYLTIIIGTRLAMPKHANDISAALKAL